MSSSQHEHLADTVDAMYLRRYGSDETKLELLDNDDVNYTVPAYTHKPHCKKSRMIHQGSSTRIGSIQHVDLTR